MVKMWQKTHDLRVNAGRFQYRENGKEKRMIKAILKAFGKAAQCFAQELKAQGKSLRKFEIPSDKMQEFADNIDDNSRAGRYKLWTRITELFPETREGVWVLDASNAARYYVVEVL